MPRADRAHATSARRVARNPADERGILHGAGEIERARNDMIVSSGTSSKFESGSAMSVMPSAVATGPPFTVATRLS